MEQSLLNSSQITRASWRGNMIVQGALAALLIVLLLLSLGAIDSERQANVEHQALRQHVAIHQQVGQQFIPRYKALIVTPTAANWVLLQAEFEDLTRQIADLPTSTYKTDLSRVLTAIMADSQARIQQGDGESNNLAEQINQVLISWLASLGDHGATNSAVRIYWWISMALACFAMAITGVAGMKTRAANRLVSQQMSKVKRHLNSAHTCDHIWQNSCEAMLSVDIHGEILAVNPKLTDLLGYHQDYLLGRPVTSIMPPEQAKVHQPYFEGGGGLNLTSDVPRYAKLYSATGKAISVALQVSRVTQEGGAYYLVQVRDLHEQRLLQQQLQQATVNWDTLFHFANEPLAALNARGEITDLTQAFAEMLGYQRGQIKGNSIYQFLLPHGYLAEADVLQQIKDAREPILQSELIFISRHGHELATPVRTTVVRDDNKRCQQIYLAVDTANLASQITIQDQNTKLRNELGFKRAMQRVIDECRVSGMQFSLLLFRCCEYEDVLLEYGYGPSEELLQKLIERLVMDVRATDIFCRLSNGQFALISSHASEQPPDMLTLRDKLIEQASIAVPTSVGRIHPTLNVGISYYPDDGDSRQALFDTALQRCC